MSQRLLGKACVVTGAAGGIGSATCKRFAEEGAIGVICTDIDEAALKEVVADINQEFGQGKAIALKVDVSNAKEVKHSVDLCVTTYGRIDVYFANAGILGKYRPLSEETEDSFLRTLQVNTLGPFMAMKYASEAMKKTAGGGSIIVTSSIASIRADLTPLQYAASKGALLSLVIAANDRLLLDRVRVNAVLPGGVITNMVMGVARYLDEQNLELKGYDSQKFPYISPEEIASVVLFLASDESSPIKGQAIIADNGMANNMGSQPPPTKKTAAKL